MSKQLHEAERVSLGCSDCFFGKVKTVKNITSQKGAFAEWWIKVLITELET
jgi:hypothetical protein